MCLVSDIQKKGKTSKMVDLSFLNGYLKVGYVYLCYRFFLGFVISGNQIINNFFYC